MNSSLEMAKNYRSASNRDNIIKLNKNNFSDFCYTNTSNWNNFSKACKENNIDMSKILLLKDGPMLQNVFYHPSKGVYENIMLDPKYFTMFSVPQRIEMITEKINKYYESKDWELYFAFVPDAFKIIEFENIFPTLDKDEVFDCFKAAYTRLDYSRGLWNKEMVEDIIKYQKSKNDQSNENIITIYRGEGNESALVDEAFSWTTNREVAESFADKGFNGVVFEATIKEKDVVFVEDTGEDEVLVLYNDLLTLDDMPL